MSKYSDYLKSCKQKDNDFFYGKGNLKKISNKYFQFKTVLDDDNIIIFSKNLTIIKDSPVMIVAENKAIYLKHWQYKAVETFEGIQGFLVKINRYYFKPYTFKACFAGFEGMNEYDFDQLLEIAKEQEIFQKEQEIFYKKI